MTANVQPIGRATETEVTMWPSLTNTHGTLRRLRWSELFAELSRVQAFKGDEHPGWSAAVFRDNRRAKGRVLRVTAACLDYDGTSSPDAAVEQWRGIFGLLHTTRSHTEDSPRFRIVLPLSRPVSWFEWEALWRRLNAHAGGTLDGGAKDASRFWYMPGIREGGEFWARELDGDLLDVDSWLAKPEPAEAARHVPAPVSRDGTAEPSIMDRARAYLAKVPESIEGQQGNRALWIAALHMGRGFALSEGETFQLLRDDFNPRCRPPWDARELERTARNAVNNAKVPDGYILKSSRDWDPRRIATVPRAEPYQDTPPGWVEIDAADLPDHEEQHEQKLTALTMRQILDGVVERAKSEVEVIGISTCHPNLDDYLCGFRRRKITVLGARTNFGKSSYVITVSDEAMRKGERVLVVSVEDTEDLFGQRWMSRRSRVNASKIRANRLDKGEISKMEAAAGMAEEFPFFINAVGASIEQICDRIREVAEETKPSLVIFDYLQRITSRGHDRRNEITRYANMLGDTIKGCNAAGIVVSQLARPDKGNPNRRPTMFDLKESGDIENSAEHVLLGWHEPPPQNQRGQGIRHLIVGKNKDGPMPDDGESFPMPFDIATASFGIGTRIERRDDYIDSRADEWAGQFDERRFP